MYGLFGVMTGKIGDVVMSVRNGEQISRRYNPVVYNPSTARQVAARAKLKLMSELSAIMAPVIAIPRDGVVSTRNLFVKKNYPLASYADDTAQISLPSVQLTNSVVTIPSITATREGTTARVALDAPVTGLSRVVYIAFQRQSDGKLRFASSESTSVAGDGNTYPLTIALGGNRTAYVYAYGVRDNTDAAKAIFGSITVPDAMAIAELIVTRVLTETDVTLTETRGVEVPVSA